MGEVVSLVVGPVLDGVGLGSPVVVDDVVTPVVVDDVVGGCCVTTDVVAGVGTVGGVSPSPPFGATV